ncbi:GerAB/ArcD/ProY family transporter [Clostridium cavendishii]
MYSSIFIDLGGRVTFIFTIIASIILILFSLTILNICSKHNNFDFKQICLNILGNKLGKFYIFLFSLTLILSTVESLAIPNSVIHENIFLETPIWYGILLFTITGYFISKKDLNSIVSVTSISMFFILISLFLIAVLSNQHKDFSNLLPINFTLNKENSLCLISQIGSLSSFVILLPIINLVEDKNNLKSSILKGLIIAFIIVIFFIIGIIATFGPIRGGNTLYPIFSQCQMISYGGFIENGSILLLIFFILSWLCKYMICLYSLTLLFNVKDKNTFVIFISILNYFLALIIGNNVFFTLNFIKYYQYLLFVIFFAIPLIIYILYHFKLRNTKVK